jgi:predicted Zn-dependent protease with MMP-like domain
MIIMDLSNLVFSQVLDFERTTKMQPDMQVIRNLVIDRMRTHKEKLREFADEIVIAVDSRYY